MSRIRLLPTGPRPFFLRQAAHRGHTFEVFWSGAGSPPDRPGFFLLRGIDSFGTAAESLREVLADPASVRLLAGGASLLLDCSSEGPALSGEHLFQMHLAFEQLKVPPSRVVLLHQNALLPAQYGRWLRGQPAFAPMRLFDYHYYLEEMVIRRRNAVPSLAEMRAITGRSAAAGTRPFLCLNNRAKEHRLVVLGHLARHGLLDQGIVSCRLGRYGEDDFGVDAVLPRAEATYPGFASDIAAFLALRPSLPLRPGEPPEGADIGSDPGFDLHRRAFLALVTESEMRRDVVRFTEKSLKPLFHGMPFLVAGNRGTLAALRATGFQTFAPAIDESYDEIEDPAERLGACLAEFRRLVAQGPEAMERLFAALWPVCWHNMNHFAQGLQQRSLETERGLVRVLRGALAHTGLPMV